MGIKLKRSAVAGKTPTSADLELGELAINTWDGKLYLRRNDGADAILEVGPVRSVAGKTGDVALAIADIASLQAALDGKQAADADLAAIAALAGTSGLLRKTAANAWSLDTVSYAPLASPTFTGTPGAVTPAFSADDGQLATTAFVQELRRQIVRNTQTGTTYTPVAGDAGKAITLNNAAAITVTINSAVFSAEDRVDFIQYGAGQVTFAAGAGFTLRSSGSKLKLGGQYSGATIYFLSATEGILIGDITT